jgi:hypothetical protein
MLREAEARANQQTAITQSELSITVKENEGKAALRLAMQQADQTRALARAEADRVKIIGEGEAAKMVAIASADAERITKTGLATAETIAKQAEASGGSRYQLTRQVVERLAEALEKSGVDIVPGSRSAVRETMLPIRWRDFSACSFPKGGSPACARGTGRGLNPMAGVGAPHPCHIAASRSAHEDAWPDRWNELGKLSRILSHHQSGCPRRAGPHAFGAPAVVVVRLCRNRGAPACR